MEAKGRHFQTIENTGTPHTAQIAQEYLLRSIDGKFCEYFL